MTRLSQPSKFELELEAGESPRFCQTRATRMLRPTVVLASLALGAARNNLVGVGKDVARARNLTLVKSAL